MDSLAIVHPVELVGEQKGLIGAELQGKPTRTKSCYTSMLVKSKKWVTEKHPDKICKCYYTNYHELYAGKRSKLRGLEPERAYPQN